mgnify:CR=1 FL=1
MRERMIINARHDLGLPRRVLSDVVTALMWCGWLLLWLPVFLKLRQVVALHLYFAPAAIELADVSRPIPLIHSIIALLGTSGLLLLWSLLPSRRLTHAHGVQTLDDYAEYFDLDPAEILIGRSSQICVVSHDDRGNIIGIAPRD